MDVFLSALASLTQGFTNLSWQGVIMIALACVLLYIGIGKKIEPLLLVPIAFGVLLGNLPLAGLSASYIAPDGEPGVMKLLYDGGILTELFPVLLLVTTGLSG